MRTHREKRFSDSAAGSSKSSGSSKSFKTQTRSTVSLTESSSSCDSLKKSETGTYIESVGPLFRTKSTKSLAESSTSSDSFKKKSDAFSNNPNLHHDGVLHRISIFMARNSCIWFHMAFSTAGVLTLGGIFFGEGEADFTGWWTRGTPVANRCTQVDILNRNRAALFTDKTGEFWHNLMHAEQVDEREYLVRRRLSRDRRPRNLLSDQILAEQGRMTSPLPIVADDDHLGDDDERMKGRFQNDDMLIEERRVRHLEQQKKDDKLEDFRRRVRDLQLQLPEGCVIPGLPPDFVIPEDFEIPEGAEIPPGCEGLLPTMIPTSPPSVTPTIAPTRAPSAFLEGDADDLLENNSTNTTSPSFAPTIAPTPNRTESPTPAPSNKPTESEFPPCDSVLPYSDGSLFSQPSVWPVWRTHDRFKGNFLEGDTLQSLCEQEQITQQILYDNDLCQRCGDGSSCYQPFSLVFFARLAHPFGLFLNCSELGSAWESIKDEVVPELVQCAQDINAEYNQRFDGAVLPDSCPPGFFTHMIDNEFYFTGTSVSTTSIFVTDPTRLAAQFHLVDSFGNGDENIAGAYDTQYETFLEFERDLQLETDILLAIISAFITSGAMIVHTKSLFLANIGLMQIILSFPIANLTYSIGFNFFPFLNFVGIFIIFALGADDVFVVVDKWKNARMEFPEASTEFIASMAFPDAAEAMFLTTSTTAAAFLATAGSPIAPIKCFSVFLGLLVIFDYILCIMLVFPAICIYDKLLQREAGPYAKYYMWYFSFIRTSDLKDAHVKPESLIRRILRNYHKRLHLIREPVFILCFSVVLISFVQASRMKRPAASTNRVFDENDNQFEQRYLWNENILLRDIFVKEISTVNIVWGVTPADTGDLNNPGAGSQLVLEDTFQPSKPEVQIYLRDFCDRLYAQEFAGPIDNEFRCAMRGFDTWLQEQSISSFPSPAYANNCKDATELPLASDAFDACMYAWSQEVGDDNVLATNSTVEIIIVPFTGRAKPTSSFEVNDREFKLIENWLDAELATAPAGAERAFFGNHGFWWYDTNRVLLDGAVVASAIAMGVTGIVILFSSRSFMLTLFAMGTVGYVIVSVAAMLISLGWTIGFLESVLFSILIGLSCDFVVHLCHAYTQFTGYAPRSERTLFALITMGPSILAAAFTTVSAACSMLFAVIIFFSKFATILLFAMLQASFGTFVVFIALVDYIGPCNPNQTVDGWLNGLFGLFGGEFHPPDGMPYDPNLEVLRGKNPEWPVLGVASASADDADASAATTSGREDGESRYFDDSP